MSNFEDEFKDLPWRKPSDALKDRIFSSPAGRPPSSTNTQKRMPVKWSVVMASVVGLLGFMAGTIRSHPTAVTNVASIGTDIRIVETFSARNSFDFTAHPLQILPGEFTTSISVDGETESQQ